MFLDVDWGVVEPCVLLSHQASCGGQLIAETPQMVVLLISPDYPTVRGIQVLSRRVKEVRCNTVSRGQVVRSTDRLELDRYSFHSCRWYVGEKQKPCLAIT